MAVTEGAVCTVLSFSHLSVCETQLGALVKMRLDSVGPGGS
jgi:hypothetical protein